MSLTKIYKYKIKPGTENAYLKLQEKSVALYRKYAEVEFLYLKDANDPLKKTEVIRFFDIDAIAISTKIDQDPEILRLFNEFKTEIWDSSSGEIEGEVLQDEALSSAGKSHHIELYCSNLDKSSQFWSWFLGELGYKQYQKWSEGVSFKLGDSYIVFVQAAKEHMNSGYHRCRPGLNHLAFHAINRAQVDSLTEQLKSKGFTILYQDKHPYAGGPETYAVYFEDPERMKVEVVAP